jgi:hypothetical protein
MVLTPTYALDAGAVRLRPIREADASPLQRLLSDRRVYEPTSYDVLGLEQTQALIADWLAKETMGLARRWFRALEKCSFNREGLLRKYRVCRGEPRDFYALLRPGAIRRPANIHTITAPPAPGCAREARARCYRGRARAADERHSVRQFSSTIHESTLHACSYGQSSLI